MKINPCIVLLFSGLLAHASDKPAYPDWPTLPAVPNPMPDTKVVKVEPIGALPVGKLYVVQHSDAPIQLLASPEGIVKVTTLPSGAVINGVFVDGKGDRETRVYSGKQVFLVERAAPGAVELLKVPVGPVDRRVIAADTPVPEPIPPPKPDDPKPPPVTEKSPWDNAPGMRVLIVQPLRGVLTAEQQAIITGKKVREYLDAKTVKAADGGYWMVKTDEDLTDLSPGYQRAYATVKGDRWVVVGNGPKWTAQPLPANGDAMIQLLKGYE